MYFFYFDESGSRDPSAGAPDKPKDHIYVLLAVGMFEGQWRPFDTEISRLKLELADYLERDGKGRFDLADCEVKSNWIRIPKARKENSAFLDRLHPDDLRRIVDMYFRQIEERKTVITAAVIDKRYLHEHITHDRLHTIAYEFLLERIQNYIWNYHSRHRALIVMDDTSRQLNQAVAMRHASFQRSGNRNMTFPAIVEYPFFARSELSNGVQLADLLAYNVYRAFKDENLAYPPFERMVSSFYRDKDRTVLHGLKVWPEASPLVETARRAWDAWKKEHPPEGG